MNEQIIESQEVPFKDFLFKNRRNMIIIMLAVAAIVVQFVIFKYLYPFASYIHGDSFNYLQTANKNWSINTYMIGYAMFLRLFSVFTTSDLALAASQYLLIQASALFLLFTTFYFYKPTKVLQTILICFMVFNPLFLYMGNLVSSDALFLALSLIWFSLLLWIIYKSSFWLLLWHTRNLYCFYSSVQCHDLSPNISNGVCSIYSNHPDEASGYIYGFNSHWAVYMAYR
jgi:hypothetical protein